MINAKIDYKKNEKFDNLYTPERAVKPLLNYVHTGLKIWECCDHTGDSNISKVLRDYGCEVITSDIRSGFDFLTDTQTQDFDIIVTNPPYSLKDKFLQRCYEYGKPFALLLPLTALEGIQRSKMFQKYGISVIVLDRRIDFTGKKACWFNVSWFTHGIVGDYQLYFEEVFA